MDIALLLIHGFVGALLLAHGIGHLFGKLGSGGGLAATSEYVASLGLRPARLMGFLLGATEIAAGALFAVGLLTPLAAAGIAALMIVATFTDHRGHFWIFDNGSEYVLTNAVVALALAFSGPGRYSLDHALGLDLAGNWWGVAAAAAAVGGAVFTLAVFREHAPHASPQGA
jgi:putative oxidoreductase